jgi:hypothetical protein
MGVTGFDIREGGIGCGKPIVYTPVDGGADVEGKIFALDILNASWGFSEFGKKGDRISNIRVGSNIWVYDFTKDSLVGESHFMLKAGTRYG